MERLIDRAALAHGSNDEPYFPSDAVEDVGLDGPEPQGTDVYALLNYLNDRLSPRETDATDQRLDADDRLYSIFLLIERARADARDQNRATSALSHACFLWRAI